MDTALAMRSMELLAKELERAVAQRDVLRVALDEMAQAHRDRFGLEGAHDPAYTQAEAAIRFVEEN